MTQTALPPTPFIVTLRLDPASFARVEALRRTHFPASLNFIPAHVSLFHKLEGEVADTLRAAAERPSIPLLFTGYRSLGRGVCLKVEAPELLAVRRELASAFRDQLTPQDRQGYGPHVTIQNKVTPAEARTLLDRLSTGFEAFGGTGEGLLLWRYLGGPWALEAEFPFTG